MANNSCSVNDGGYYLLQVLQNILETEHDYSKELQSMLSTYLRPLQTSEK